MDGPHWKLLLVDELVVNDGSGQADAVVGLLRFLGAHDAALAHHVAVLLPGDFLGHLEHHLNQGINGQLLRSGEKNAGLADIFDDSLVPRCRLVHAETEWQIQLQASRPRYPGGALFARVGAPDAGFGLGMLHALNTAHGGPVILVLGGTDQADLVIVSVSSTTRPGEFVGTAP